MPPLPATPPPEAPIPSSFSVGEIENGPDTDVASHYQSERDLFELPPPSPALERDYVDVAAFLEMGHVPNCWCRPCQEPSEDDGSVSLPKLSAQEVDEGWMVCEGSGSSTNVRSPSKDCGGWEWEWGTIVEGDEDGSGSEEVEMEEVLRAKGQSWDEMFPPLPSAKAHGAW